MPRVGTKRYRGFASIAHYEASLHLQDSKDSGKSDLLQLPSRAKFEATPAKRRRMSVMLRLSDSDQDLLLDVKSLCAHFVKSQNVTSSPKMCTEFPTVIKTY